MTQPETTIDPATLWTVIICLAVGSFSLRFLFIGLVGNKEMPTWLMRHLRYTAVAMLPALVTPLVIWPSATGGVLDAPRFCAALVALGIGYFTKNVVAAMASGAAVLYLLLYLI